MINLYFIGYIRKFNLHIIILGIMLQTAWGSATVIDPSLSSEISGRVLTEFGQSISDVFVYLYASQCGTEWIGVSRTDKLGNYKFVGLKNATYYLFVQGSTKLYQDYWWSSFGGTPYCDKCGFLTITDDLILRQKNFLLPFQQVITGQIMDSSNNPVIGLYVTLYQNENSTTSADEKAMDWVDETMTQSDGSFSFTQLSERAYHIHVWQNHTQATTHYVDQHIYNVLPDPQTPLTITMEKGYHVFGFVFNQLEEPIRGIIEACFNMDSTPCYRTEINQNGQYDLYLPDSSGQLYSVRVIKAYQPGRRFFVYGGSRILNTTEAKNSEDYGYTKLGESTDNAFLSLIGSYDYYLISVEKNYETLIDYIGGGDVYWTIQKVYNSVLNQNAFHDQDGQYIHLAGKNDEPAFIIIQPDQRVSRINIIYSTINPLLETIMYVPKSANDLFEVSTEYQNIKVPDIILHVQVQPGDINADGSINIADSILAIQILASNSTYPVQTHGDINSDHKIGLEDSIYILKILAEY